VKEPLRYGTLCPGISQFYLRTHAFMHEWNEPYLPLPSLPKLVLIYIYVYCITKVAQKSITNKKIKWQDKGKRYSVCTSTYSHNSPTHLSLYKSANLQSIDAGGIEGWVGLSSTAVCKQSAQYHRHVVNVVLVQTRAFHWASGCTRPATQLLPGAWGPSFEPMTFWVANHNANHCASTSDVLVMYA